MKVLDVSTDAAIAGATLAAIGLVTRNAVAANAKLLVFLHVAIKQRALQSELQSAMPGIDVTAVGRVGDWERALKEGADAVVALPLVLSAYKLTPKLRGQRAGATDEPYSLIGVGVPPEPSKVATVGALDLLGREGTNSFVKNLVGASPKVERVSKVEDLLPLLQMQRADAILLPTRLFYEIKTASKLALVAKDLGKSVGLPAGATVTAQGTQVLSALAKISTNASKTLGVDSWR